MSKTIVLYDRMLTAKFLSKNAEWNCDHTLQDPMHLHIVKDGVNFERIFKYKLISKTDFEEVRDLEVEIEAGIEHTGVVAANNVISLTISNGDGNWAMGIQCRTVSGYNNLGPYLGIEGEAGRVLKYPALKEQFQERTVIEPPLWPRVFNVRIKPMEKVAVCHTAIDRGHLLTVVYDEYNPMIDITKDNLYLDLYRMDDLDFYTINYIKVKVTAYVTERAEANNVIEGQ